MPLCTDCGKQLEDGAVSCVDCGNKPGVVAKAKGPSARKKKLKWFLVGLLIILAIGGMLYVTEQASLPFELRRQIAFAEEFRKLPDWIQRDIARQKGKTIEELSTSPYDRWAPKVVVGLLAAWGGAWGAYMAYVFFRHVDREGTR